MKTRRKTGELDRRIGSRIRELRSASGLSQGRLGKPLGLSFQQIQKYEMGLNRVSASCLYEMAQLLGVPVTDLYGPTAEAAEPHTKEGLALLAAFRAIPDPMLRTSIIVLTRSLAG